MRTIVWPEGKKFAFTIVDDTDRCTVANTKPIYDFLLKCGFRTTKTVWPLHCLGAPATGGQCLEDSDYRSWILALQTQGAEIALHGTADGSSQRERVIQGLDLFAGVLGHHPDIHVNHVGQKECLYWGENRFDGLTRQLYKLVSKRDRYYGHVQGTPYFWGDLCEQRIKFVRNLTFTHINTLKMDPLMPYHDARRAHVRFWFSSSDGSGVPRFCRLLSEANQDLLLEEGGACIVYTHLGSGFAEDPSEFMRLMRRLAGLPGWFVPASTLLNYLGSQRGWCKAQAHPAVHRNMQFSWITDHVRQWLWAKCRAQMSRPCITKS